MGTDVTRMECSICFENVDQHDREPQGLQCGHTLCKSCVSGLFSAQRAECPQCLVSFDEEDEMGAEEEALDEEALEA